MKSQSVTLCVALCGFIAAFCESNVAGQELFGGQINVQGVAVEVELDHGLIVPDPQIAFRLTHDHRVLRELKCTLEQRETIEDAIDAIEDELAEDGPIPEEGEQAADRRKELFEEFETLLRDEILNPDQIRRLDEMELRLRGPRAFRVPRVNEALNLTETQNDFVREQIAVTAAEIQQQSVRDLVIPNGRAQIFAPPGPAEMLEILETGVQNIVDQLTDEQRETWNKLVGAELQRAPRIQLFNDPRGGHWARAQGMMMMNVVPALPAIALPIEE